MRINEYWVGENLSISGTKVEIKSKKLNSLFLTSVKIGHFHPNKEVSILQYIKRLH